MNARKTALSSALAMAMGGVSLSANAALTSSTVLVFDEGVAVCLYGGTYPNCKNGASDVTAGSFFSMDANGNGSVAGNEKVPLVSAGGVSSDKGAGFALHDTFDNTNNPMGSHGGSINGNESPRGTIWEFFGNTGMDYLTKPMTDLGANPDGSHDIDMTGWNVTWNGIDAIPMGGDPANFGGDTGVGLMTCSNASCSQSSTFSLVYDAHVPLGDVSNFGGVAYSLSMTGVIGQNLAHIPVPAAVWLFGSGLVGLVGVARRKKA